MAGEQQQNNKGKMLWDSTATAVWVNERVQSCYRLTGRKPTGGKSLGLKKAKAATCTDDALLTLTKPC